MLEQLLRLLTFQDANTRIVLIGTTILGMASAVIGAFAVLRKQALVGDAVAHAALPGICLAFWVVGDRNFAAFMVGALIFGLIAAAFVAFVRSATRIKEDAAIGLAIGGFFGLGIVLSRVIQNDASGNRAGLDSFIFGKAASMVTDDAELIAIVAGVVLATVGLLYKEFKVLSFDRGFAESQGWPVVPLDLTIMLLICVCTVVGLPAVGVVLMVSLLVIPPAAARFWTDNLGTMVVLSGIFGGLAGMLGTALSATIPAPVSGLTRGWPTGPLITLTAAAIFMVSMFAAPRRGIIGEMARRLLLRRRVARQNLLRRVYEALEPGGDLSRGWSLDNLDAPSDRERRAVGREVHRATRSGLVAPTGTGWVLTARGQAAASRIVRAHRLWEIFLITQAGIAPDRVDRDADEIEHVLPPETLADLEARLAEAGRVPLGPPNPPSPHSSAGAMVN